jgi:hypothetical protein
MIGKPAWVAASVLLWTLIAWGGRIGLLTDGHGWADLLRIGGSLLVGLATALALAVPSVRPRAVPLFFFFCLWTAVLWGRTMIVNWSGAGSLPFKLVHTVLAIGFLILIGSVWGFARESKPELEASPVQSGH